MVEAMIADLKAEKGKEINLWDEFTENLHKKEVRITAKDAEVDNRKALIDDLSNSIATLKDETANFKAEVATAMPET